MRRFAAALAVTTFILPISAAAQETRIEALERKRAERATRLRPYERTRLEKLVMNAERGKLRRLFAPHNGFFVEYGYARKPVGSGIGFGGGCRQDLFGRRARILFETGATLRKCWMSRADFSLPRLANGRLQVGREARFSDPRATQYITATLLERRRKVLEAWLNGTNPIVDIALSATGQLTFENAAERAGVAAPADRYALQWSHFDNATGSHHDVGAEDSISQRRAQAPAAPLQNRTGYIAVRLRGIHSGHEAWSHPLVAYFRSGGDGWSLVGLERNP